MKVLTVARSQKLISFFLLFSLIFGQFSVFSVSPVAAVSAVPAQTEPQADLSLDALLLRTHVTLRQANDLGRIEAMGAIILEAGDEEALLLVTADQLESLARLRFQPKATDSLHNLAYSEEAPAWLPTSLQPILTQAEEQQKQMDAGLIETKTAMAEISTLLAGVTTEQGAALASLSSIDDDGDGLTNLEEAWWCTDPLNPNSDGDAAGYTDGEEVAALLDVTQPRSVRWGYGAPFGPPNAWPDFNGSDGNPNTPACNDGDYDTIPDFAEVYIVGSRVPSESTDNDKFDDGQEFFGVTYCPGTPCVYGEYPPIEYQTHTIDYWVEPPGDNLFVAAFPIPKVSVVPGSWTVEKVTVITTEQGEMTQETNTYETSVTDGQSTSIADTVTWNEWEEVSESIEIPINSGQLVSVRFPEGIGRRIWGGAQIVGGIALTGGAAVACAAGTVVTIGGASIPCVAVIAGAGALSAAIIDHGWDDLTNPDDVQDQIQVNNINSNTIVNDVSANAEVQANINLSQNFDTQGIIGSLDGVQYAINQQGELLARGLYDISYQISRPRYTETRTNGISWGGSQTTTNEVYEEHTISEGEAFTTGQNWSTAFAVDSSHAADLTFNYTIENTGTEYAREIRGIIFNIYLGDDTTPLISYRAWEQFPNGKIENIFPGEKHNFASTRVPLTLEQMKRIDLGEKLTVILEDFSYGVDEEFYQKASTGGVTFFIEDGIADNDETVDTYIIPTWGTESVQDVLGRYFPIGTDADGYINSIQSPEFNGTAAPNWHEHYLSDIAWWNIYLTQPDSGNTPLSQLPATADSALLFRFNRDSDRDGYQDRVEWEFYCTRPASDPLQAHCADAYTRPEIHPQPEIVAGYTTSRVGNEVTALLSLANLGTFDAYGIDAVMYAPDATTTIGNNTVGGNGRVRPGAQVSIGSLIKPPDLTGWTHSTATAYTAGEFTGDADTTITFTVNTIGTVGSGSTALNWVDNSSSSGTVDLGSGYQAPLPIDIINGVQIGFNTGTIISGDSFTVTALTPRDTFTYTINSEPYTPPVIVVSYSDPQGSHRFVTPVELSSLDEDLTPYNGQMLADTELMIATETPVAAGENNTVDFVLNNPHPATIEDAHLYLNFVADGQLVAELPYTMTLPTGPTTYAVDWTTDVFSQTFDAEADNILIAFWTDAQNNIIDADARPLNTFGEDITPIAAYSTTQIDFGTVAQGQLLHTEIAVANTGVVNLLNAFTTSGNELTVSSGLPNLYPASFVTVSLNLDTSNLPIGAYTGNFQVRTNDTFNPIQTISVIANIVDSTSVAYSTDNEQPLNEYILINGSYSANSIANTVSSIPLHEETEPLYFMTEDGTIAGKGNIALELGEPLNLAYETNPIIDIKSLDSETQPETSQAPLGAFSNPSFETGSRYPWAFLPYNTACNWAVYNWPPDAFHGSWLLATNMNNNPNCSGFYQDDNTQPMSVGDTYRFAIWVRSAGPTRNGTLSLWALGGTQEVAQTGFSVGSSWTCVETSLAIQRSGHSSMRTEVYLTSVDSWNYYFDNASFTRNGGAICPTPGTPTINSISNSSGNGSYTISWNPTSYALSYQLQEKYGTGSWSTVYDGLSASTTRSGRTPGTWCYQVRATNNAGSSSYSGTQCTTVKPTAAPNLSNISNSDGDGSYSISWSSVTGATNYQLQEQYNVGSWSTIYTGSSTTQNLVGRSTGDWCYQVRANNAGGDGPWSSTKCASVNIPPNMPFNMFPTNGAGWLNRTVTLNWQDGGDPDNAPNPYRDFHVQIESGVWNTTTTWTQSESWTGIVPVDDIYSWRVEAYDGLETSGWTPDQILRVYSIDKTGTNQIGIALPQNVSDFVRYEVQYGVVATITGSLTPSVVHITLPKRTYSAATLDLVLVEAIGSNISFAIDVGNDGLDIWSDAITWDGVTPIWASSPDLATALNTYLSTQGVSGGTMVDVPIGVSLDTEGIVYLTNAILTPGIDIDPAVSASNISLSNPSPMETNLVTVAATIDNLGDYEAQNIMATFVVTDPVAGPVVIGNDFVPTISSGGSAQANIIWDTSGYSGDINLSVVLDVAAQLAELDEDNNTATIIVPVRSRPDLQSSSWSLLDPEPVAGEIVTITVDLLNDGQTASGVVTHALYNGNPNDGGILLDSQTDGGLGGNGSGAVAFSWLPTLPGPYRLFLRLDENDTVNEFNEANNLFWQDVYVGLAGPVLLDSGVTASDPAYSSTVGYGYVDTGSPDVLLNCSGSDPEDTLRRDPDGSVNYRFNHLQPGHFYHLDITLYECDGAGRQEDILVDGHLLAGPEDLGDGEVHKLSLRLDPALYADRMIEVSITAPGIDGAVVAAVNLHDVDYRYADAGGNADPEYDNNSDYGWLDGVANTAWGTLPYQSVRVDQNDNQVSYRFDNLNPSKRYNVWVTFWQGTGAARIQKVRIDGLETGVTVDSGDFLQHEEKISVPLGSYASDGSIVVSINRLNASSGAMVNEIALEEETLASAATCDVQTTPFFSQVYGSVALAGAAAPPGTVVQAFNPRGDVVGCFTVNNSGLYGFMRVYGEDNTANPPIPGMRAGELVSFKVSGSPAVATPLFYWRDDKTSHPVNLNAAAMDAQFILLSPGWNWLSLNLEPPTPLVAQAFDSIDGRYDRVLGETGIYDVNLPPVFNSLTEIHAGLGYMLRITGTASVNLLAAGVSIPPTTPIFLHQGWNWVGYLAAENLPITVALQSITGQYQLVLGQDGTFDPDLPQFSDLQEMSPGNGYMIYADTAVTLIYPASSQANHTSQAAPMGNNPAQTPQFTIVYGEVKLNGTPASLGTIIEAVTPRGGVAGRFMVQRSGLYGFMRVYGEDETAVPTIPGFRDGEEITWRVNGHDIESASPMYWQNDWATHEIELNLLGYWNYLPIIK